MSWLNEYKRIWRTAVLVLFLAALVGPWAFDQTNVPAQYPCTAPSIRLQGDFCGLPLSLMWVLSALIHSVAILATTTTTMADLALDLPAAFLILLLLLPVFSTLLLFLSGNRRRRRIFHLAAWSLATLMSLWYLRLVFISFGLSSLWLWGLLLYVVLGLTALILEGALLIRPRRARAGAD